MDAARRIAIATLALLPCIAAAQSPPAYGCDTPESRQLDFWIGEWELTHSGGRSRNRIARTLDGCAIVEQFTGAPGTRLDGTSLSTYDRATSRWRQVWVDNTGAWLDFVGGEDAGDRTFEREFEKDGRRIRQRMVFREVRADSLKWLWQRSDDGGATWKTTWQIDYRRARQPAGKIPPLRTESDKR